MLPDIYQFSSFRSLIEAVAQSRHGAAVDHATLLAEDYQKAEREVPRQAQQDSFAEEFSLLKAGKSVGCWSSRLLSLAPEYDETVRLIWVGGRLRRSDLLEPDTIHPVVLDPRHKVTQLLIQDIDKSGAPFCKATPQILDSI